MKNVFYTFIFSGMAVAWMGCGPPVIRPESGDSPSPGRTEPEPKPAEPNNQPSGNLSVPDVGNQSPMPSPEPEPSAEMNCGLNKIQLKSKPGNLLLVLDRSGSMADPLNGQATPRWDEVVGALDEVVKKSEETIAWGLKLYPQGGVCNVPDGITVPMMAKNHMTVMGQIRQNVPEKGNGATPTAEAIRKATAALKSDATLTDPHLLIATDGVPNCIDPEALGRTVDENGAVEAVAEAKAAGVPAYVVGIATLGDAADGILNRMAEAGGHARAGTTKYFPVASRDELMAAFGAIAGEVASCTFPLNPKPPVPENVAVDVDGMRLMQDPTMMEGWHYGPGNASIVLAGKACEAVKSSPATDVRIIYGCPDQPIP